MTTGCVFCGDHVTTGDALLVLEGAIKGNGEFEARCVEGFACRKHLDREKKKELSHVTDNDFPITFKLS